MFKRINKLKGATAAGTRREISRAGAKRAMLEAVERRILFADIFVDAASLAGSPTGASWSDAFTDLQSALFAAGSGDVIKIAGGTYKPTTGSDRTATFNLKSNVTIMGGYAGVNGADPDVRSGSPTTLSGLIGASNQSYHVLTADTKTGVVLDGLRVSQGLANGVGANQDRGGGLVVLNSSVTLNSVEFLFNGNFSGTALKGGAVFVGAGSAATFTNCTFSRNNGESGGAVRVESTSVTFDRCSFRQNGASVEGAAVSVATSVTSASDPSVRITASRFTDNRASTGGAIYNVQSNLLVLNSTFLGNRGDNNGGAIENVFGSNLTVWYSTFTANNSGNGVSTGAGGAINTFQSTLTSANSIFWNNTSLFGADLNVYDNTTPPSTADVVFSIVTGGMAGTGNLGVDPKFVEQPRRDGVDFLEGDLHLRTTSPAIDAGADMVVSESVTTDLDLQQRLQGANVDMGALEGGVFVDETAPTTSVTALPAFTNNTGINVSWGGTDNVGVASYTVFVSEDGGAFTALLTDTTLTSTTYLGTAGKTYRFYCIGKDAAGNVEAKMGDAEATTTIDQTPPITAVTALPALTGQTTFTVSWGALQSSEVATYTVFVSTNNGSFVQLVANTAATSTSFTGVDGALYWFYCVGTDRAGNVEPKGAPTEAATRVDTTKPVSQVSPLPTFSNSSSIDLTFGGTDANGIATYSVFVSTNNGPYVAVVTGTSSNSATFNGAVEGSTYRFYSIATDAAGNVEAVPSTPDATTTVDLTAPVPAFVGLPRFTSQTTFQLNWGATDNLSGVASYFITLRDNGTFVAPFRTTTTDTSGTFTGVAGRTYSFRLIATDNALNNSPNEVEFEFPVTIDTTPPTSSLTVLPATTRENTVSLSWSGDDQSRGSGVASYTVFASENGGAFVPVLTDTTEMSGQIPVNDGSTYGFYVLAKDVLGQVEVKPAVAEQTIRVDRTAPVGTMNALPAVSPATVLNLSWGGTDTGGSGVTGYQLFVSSNGGAFVALGGVSTATSRTFTGVDGRTYSFFVQATDAAGNVEPLQTTGETTTTINLDVPLLAEAGTGATGAANLVFSPVTQRLPKFVNGAIVGGTVIKGSLRVRNTGTALAGGPLAVGLYLSSDGTVSSKDRLLTTVNVRRAIKLKARGTVSVPFSVTLPSDFTGTTNLLAWANRPGNGGVLAIAEGTTLDNVVTVATFPVARPQLNLAVGALTARSVKAGKSNTATLVVTNNSNVPFKGTLPVLRTVLDALGNVVSETTVSSRVTLAVGKSVRLTVKFTAPLMAGSYTLRTTLDPANVFSQSKIDDTATLGIAVT